MTNNHPITPPPELVQQLRNEAPHGIRDAGVTRELHLIHAAYRAGADQELEACCEWLIQGWDDVRADKLRATRRPKPSLRDRALHILGSHGNLSPKEHSTIRKALEKLND